MRLLADENFNGRIVRGILHKNPNADILRIQETPVYQADDPAVLEWAAEQNRILLTHDVKTMTRYAYERVAAGLSMPGVIEVKKEFPIGQAVEELLILIGASDSDEWTNQVVYIPLT